MSEVRLMFMRFKDGQILDLVRRLLTVLILLYLFLVGVNCLSTGLKMLGGDFAKSLFSINGKPFVSLMAGMLATVLFQSSSVTTAIVVGLVSSGTMTIGGAVPMIMGANLGTSVTNSLVSLGYVKDMKNFKKAFAAATVHDFFNILAVALLLPIELMTGFIEKAAVTSSSLLYGSVSGFQYKSPIKAAIKPPVKFLQSTSIDTFGKEVAAGAMIIVAGVIIIAALALIVNTMKTLIESHKGEIIDKLLSKNAYGSILFGIIITISVQSSSITTSLLVPMAGTGLLSLQAIYPITIGANIGTTATALIAALSGNMAGLSIALVHLFFNLIGACIFFPIRPLREIPIKSSMILAEMMEKSRLVGVAYIGVIFFLLPISLIFFSK